MLVQPFLFDFVEFRLHKFFCHAQQRRKDNKRSDNFLLRYKWWFIICLLLAFIGFIVIYFSFCGYGFIPTGNELSKSDWLLFLSGYLSFAGTVAVALIATLQSHYYNEQENKRRYSERKKKIQPVYRVERTRDYTVMSNFHLKKRSMFSGLVYCADCGAKLHYRTASNFEDRQDHFVCSNYKSNTGTCSAHFIRAVVLSNIVLEHLRYTVGYVQAHEADFIQAVMDKSVADQKRETAQKGRELAQAERRIAELDTLFQRIYEDVCCKG